MRSAATTRPTKLGQRLTHWSIRRLAAYLRKGHGHVIRIGRQALRCLLRRRGITFQRTKTWKESPDPDRDAKLDRIEQVLERLPDRVFAFDEFGPLGIRPTAGSCWATQGEPSRLPATYRRTQGVTYFHGCYSVGDDRLWGVNRRRKGAANTLAALKSIGAARPDGAPIYIILDNFSAHTGADIRRWAKEKDRSGGGRLDLPREDDDLVDEAPPQMDDVRSRQAGASIRRGEDPLVPGPFVRHVHR